MLPWDLMCERKWITPIITSIQMAGVLVGAVVAGQSADTFGRKKTFYLTLLLHSILTVAIAFVTSWMCVSASYYGFSFGVGKFSGNFYLNLYGRRCVATIMFAGGTLSCAGVVIVQNTVTGSYRGGIITGLSLAARIFTGKAWGGIDTITNESYPTVVRNLGYGASSMAARIGGIVAPFIFAGSDNDTI
ncbi:solute carrier family 22 member 4-like [Patella vulgata]|uniref:solute carrier family 22 member 4-like n=1 Tax=Patella vulgata TaxID=6465 RepID=UPI0024A87326|nr:solute carrier family 22 member 4-like [Patella vulgata]